MSITPQLIKDQEFEVKFRGFDPIEVRDYLETIANEFFELKEQYKAHLDELESLRAEKESAKVYNSSLETDMEFTRKVSEELKGGCALKDEKIKELSKEVEELQLRIADMAQEDGEHEEELLTAMAGTEEVSEALKESEAERERLQSKLEVLQEQNVVLKKEEVDFKSTLAAAQRFAKELEEESQKQAEKLTVESQKQAEKLKVKSQKQAEKLKAESRKQAETLKVESREQAEKMVEEGKAEIERIREGAREELERLPREISELKKTKGKVKAELKETLEGYLETLEVFYPDEAEDAETETEEGDELFQKIEINEDGSLKSEDLLNLDLDSAGESPAQDVDEKVIDSLLRGGEKSEVGDDAQLDEFLKQELKLEDGKQGSS